MLVYIRGSAMTWYYLCDKCQIRTWVVSERLSKECAICREKVTILDDMLICNSCSYETGMCMGCGGPIKIGDDYEAMMEKALSGKIKGRRRKKRKKARA